MLSCLLLGHTFQAKLANVVMWVNITEKKKKKYQIMIVKKPLGPGFLKYEIR